MATCRNKLLCHETTSNIHDAATTKHDINTQSGARILIQQKIGKSCAYPSCKSIESSLDNGEYINILDRCINQNARLLRRYSVSRRERANAGHLLHLRSRHLVHELELHQKVLLTLRMRGNDMGHAQRDKRTFATKPIRGDTTVSRHGLESAPRFGKEHFLLMLPSSAPSAKRCHRDTQESILCFIFRH